VPIELIDVCRTFGREVGKIFMGLASKRLREMDKILGWLCSAILCGLILGIASFGYGQQSRPTIGPTEDLPSLLKTLKENVGLYGNIVLSLETQKKISELGKREPKTVVPVIIGELKAPRASNQKALNYRMALISVLEEIGPAAEAAVPVLTEIVQNEKERNDFILLKARMALTAIGTPPARQSAKASEQKNVEQWFQKASAREIAEAVAQHSYLIRRELRSPRMSEEVIEASVTALLPMGLQAAHAGPILLRAWQDPRIGENLRSLITRALTAIGVRDIQAAAKRERQQGKVESGYVDEIVSDVQSNTSLVSTMAMQELGALGPTEKVIDVLIQSLKEKKNPGQAALILGGFGSAAGRAVPALLPYLSDQAAGANAIQALGLIGVKDDEVIAGLRRIVADEKSPYRGLAASSLGLLKSPNAIPELRLALSAPEKYTRILAAKALAALGSEATPAVPELIVLLKDPDPDIKVSAVEALGKIGPTAAAAVPQIEKQLQFPDRRLKESSVAALELIGGLDAQSVLERDARRYAAVDLSEFKRLKQAGKYEELHRFASALPRARRIQLARVMLKDPDAGVSYTASDVLIREGLEGETVPILAALLLKGTSGSTGQLDHDWLSLDGGQLFSRMKRQICDYLESNLGRYSLQEQDRIRNQVCPPSK
jgi:HEAT repeat protein